MRRTIYRNRFLVDEVLLNNTENTKIAEILLHHEILGEEGIIEGLNVSPSSTVDGAVDVTKGSAVLPNKEIVQILVDQSAVGLASSTSGDLNIVAVKYEESFSEPKPSINGGVTNLVFADPTPEIKVYTSSDFISLSSSDLEKMLVIAVVVAAGASVAIPPADIHQASEDVNILDLSNLEILKGVIIKSTNVDSTPLQGSIRYDVQNKFLSFVSPNNPSPPPLTGGGPSPVAIDTSLRDPVTLILIDPTTSPIDTLEVEVYGTSLPDSLSSFDSARLQELQDSGRINSVIINEVLDFRGLYSQNSTEVQDGLIKETKKSSAVDRRHRQKIGSGLTTSSNPHGLSLADITEIFESIPGNFRIGDGLLDTPEEAEYPRLSVNVSDKSDYTLLFESDLPFEGSRFVSPARIYLSTNGIALTVNARYNPLDNDWTKDNIAFLTVPAIKVEATVDDFSISYNLSNSVTFSSWEVKLLTDEDENFLRESLVITPNTNEEHNDSASNIFRALINEGSFSGIVDRKTPIYEDKNATGGGLRIYMGRDFSRNSGSNVIEFTYNAKNLESNTNLWVKDITSTPSYVFRFVFDSNLSSRDKLESLVYTGTSSPFNDSSFTELEFAIPGGFRSSTESNSEFLTSLLIEDNKDLLYENAVNRRKVVSLSDIGYFASEDPTVRRELINTDDPGNDPYFDRELGGFGVLDLRLPVLIQIENLNKNEQKINVPRLVWRGPQRSIVREESSIHDGNISFIGTQKYSSGVEFTFTFPIHFEEENVEIQSMTLPWDWFRVAIFGNNLNPFSFNEQEFNFNEPFDSQNRWLKFNLFAVDYLDNSVRSVNPPPAFSQAPIVWETADGSSSTESSKVIRIRNPDGGSLLSLNSSSFTDNEFLQLQVSTNQVFIDSDIPIIEYRPITIGNLIIDYTTFNIE